MVGLAFARDVVGDTILQRIILSDPAFGDVTARVRLSYRLELAISLFEILYGAFEQRLARLERALADAK
ncbi:MAG: hypothetical protein B7Z13_07190 [Caulobacterales bacterium 32-67-6]|nr:MAG: hypothetical protein B7Z13_07190 [Caulobacterales bacterium 32-67-6]